MTEEQIAYQVQSTNPLQSQDNSCTMDAGPPSAIVVSRADLEIERRHVLGRLHWLNEKLGYPPILTGKERRRQAHTK